MCIDLQKVWEYIAQSIENNMIKDKVNIYYNIDRQVLNISINYFYNRMKFKAYI